MISNEFYDVYSDAYYHTVTPRALLAPYGVFRQILNHVTATGTDSWMAGVLGCCVFSRVAAVVLVALVECTTSTTGTTAATLECTQQPSASVSQLAKDSTKRKLCVLAPMQPPHPPTPMRPGPTPFYHLPLHPPPHPQPHHPPPPPPGRPNMSAEHLTDTKGALLLHPTLQREQSLDAMRTPEVYRLPQTCPTALAEDCNTIPPAPPSGTCISTSLTPRTSEEHLAHQSCSAAVVLQY